MDKKLEQEVIEMLSPKIKSLLRQTDFQNRDDLEQELILMVIKTIQEKEFNQLPSFFELMEEDQKKYD